MSDFEKEEIEREIARSTKEFECCNCGKRVVYKDVVGQLQCRFHKSSYRNDLGVYLCCEGGKDTYGCTKCDHTQNPFYGDGFVLIHNHMYFNKIYKISKDVDVSKVEVVNIQGAIFFKIKVREF